MLIKILKNLTVFLLSCFLITYPPAFAQDGQVDENDTIATEDLKKLKEVLDATKRANINNDGEITSDDTELLEEDFILELD
ncbi:MAG: hypothetical protein HYR97_04020 [Candidatus Melainabacteria bacterium]|nr:hypothetical protein [Candidatus Melainabacteria bacterium]MBI3309509.1 hypothetical protein [Candidatus Melainabacteria bacterium]